MYYGLGFLEPYDKIRAPSGIRSSFANFDKNFGDIGKEF